MTINTASGGYRRRTTTGSARGADHGVSVAQKALVAGVLVSAFLAGSVTLAPVRLTDSAGS